MADKDSTSMIMKFHRKSGGAVEAECPLTIATGDSLATDATYAPGFLAGYYFQIKKFDFGVRVDGNESPTRMRADARGGRIVSMPFGDSGGEASLSDEPREPFHAWRTATGQDWAEPGKYPAKFDNFSFSRQIDKASPVLFQFCSQKESFASASFIKRRAAIVVDFARGASQTMDVAFLRIDLIDVLIRRLEWSDDDVMEEECKLVFKEMHVMYRQQRNDGSMAGRLQVTWKSPAQ
jgi:type VI protein secretion system component Hcp